MTTPRTRTRRAVRRLGAAALPAVVLVAGLAVPAAADPTVACEPAPPSMVDRAVARGVFDTGRAMGVNARVMLAGFETALVESRMNNCSDGDRDSVGAFQQRASWGTYAQRTTVSYAAREFFKRAVDVERRNPSRSEGWVAQKVQVSAHPDRYDQQRAPAQRLLAEVSGGSPAPAPQAPPVTVGTVQLLGGGGWSVRADGVVTPHGGAPAYGDARTYTLNAPVVAIVGTPSGRGYWLAAADGGVFTYGDAVFQGSHGARRLNRPVVGMAASPSGKGYWLVAADGGIFTFGDAAFHGSMGNRRLNAPVVGMAATPSGKGYWLGAADGGVFTFGDAAFHGSMGNRPMNAPVVGVSAVRSGKGYWLLGRDGGVFTFGDAPFRGSAAPSTSPARALVTAGDGYVVALEDGRRVAFA